MSIGTTGYSLYLGALWNFQVNGTRWFLILAGGILGFSAALFWAAQGSLMMAYPREKDKGRSFTVFWVIFQLGTLIGAAIALGIQFHSKLASVSTGVYIAFLIIMLTSIVSSWLILPPQLVVRGDGTIVELEASLSPRQELHEFVKMFRDWRMLALFPMFFASNYFYAYQGALTAALFNGRTRALVSLLTGLGSIVGSIVIGLVTDVLPFDRRRRSLFACGAVTILTCVVWGSGVGFQVKFTRASTVVLGDKIPWDWTASAAGGPIVLLFSCKLPCCLGSNDANWACRLHCRRRLSRTGLLHNVSSDKRRIQACPHGWVLQGHSVCRRSSILWHGCRQGMRHFLLLRSLPGHANILSPQTAYLTEALVSWLLILVSLPLCVIVLYQIRETNYDAEQTVHVEPNKQDTIGQPSASMARCSAEA